MRWRWAGRSGRCWWSTRGEPRNAPAGHAHNYLGREGVSPLELLADRPRRGGGVRRRGGDRPRGRPVRGGRLLPGHHRGRAEVRRPAGAGHRRRRRRAARRAGAGRAVGHRRAALPLLPRLGGARQAARDPRDDADGRPPRSAVPPAVRRRRHGRPRRRRAARRGGREAGRDRRAVRRTARRGRWSTDGDALVGLRLADGSLLERDAIVVATKPHVRADYLGPLGIEPTAVRDGRRGPRLRHRGRAHRCDRGPRRLRRRQRDRHLDDPDGLGGPRQPGGRLDQRRARHRRRDEGRRGAPRRLLRAAGVGGALLRRPGVERARQRPARGRGRRPHAGPRARRRVRRGRRRAVAGAAGLAGDGVRLRRCGAGTGRRARRGGGRRRPGRDPAHRRAQLRAGRRDVGPRHLALRAPARRRHGRRRTPPGGRGRARRHPARRRPRAERRRTPACGTATTRSCTPPTSCSRRCDDAWEVEVCESRPRTQAHPETGEEIEIADAVLRARRVG